MEQEKINAGNRYNEKQVAIMEAAEKLFASHGFDGTSVRDIAQQAAVNVAMISYYFGSKEKLLEAIFHYRIDTSRLLLEHLIGNKEMTPMEKVGMLIDKTVERLMLNSRFHQIMMREHLSESMAWFREMADEMKERNRLLTYQIVMEGQRKKVFSRHVEVPLLMTTIIGTVYHTLSSKDFYRRIYKLEHLSEEEVIQHLMKKLKSHLKTLIKAALTHEA